MAVTAMRGADELIRSSLGFDILPKPNFDMQTREIKPATIS